MKRPARRIITEYLYPPIPDRRWDWSAIIDGYDPGDPIGYGSNKYEAIDDLLAQFDEDCAEDKDGA